MVKEIKYSGFTATPSDYICPDGELDTAVNLIPEDSELHPVQLGELLTSLPNTYEGTGVWEDYTVHYKIKYIHKNASYKHLIIEKVGVNEILDDKCQLFWIDLPNEGKISDALLSVSEESNMTPIAHSYSCIKGQDLNVSSIGNTLLVTGGKDGRIDRKSVV